MHVCDASAAEPAIVDAAAAVAAAAAAAAAVAAAAIAAVEVGVVVAVVDDDDDDDVEAANSENGSVLPSTVGDARSVFKCSVLPLLFSTVRAMSECERNRIFSPYNGVMPCSDVEWL